MEKVNAKKEILRFALKLEMKKIIPIQPWIESSMFELK